MYKIKIMIVDDDSTSLAIGKAILGSKYDVVLMKSGLQALGYLKDNEKPNVILLDMVMPGKSGMETLKALKSEDNLRDIPVLFLTSNDDRVSEAEALKSGAEDFISKPVNPDLLKLKIERQIEYQALIRENQTLKEKLQKIRELTAFEYLKR